MRNWIVIIAFALVLAGCSGIARKELAGSTEGEGSDALRASPCACEFRDFHPDLYEWVQS